MDTSPGIGHKLVDVLIELVVAWVLGISHAAQRAINGLSSVVVTLFINHAYGLERRARLIRRQLTAKMLTGDEPSHVASAGGHLAAPGGTGDTSALPKPRGWLHMLALWWLRSSLALLDMAVPALGRCRARAQRMRGRLTAFAAEDAVPVASAASQAALDARRGMLGGPQQHRALVDLVSSPAALLGTNVTQHTGLLGNWRVSLVAQAERIRAWLKGQPAHPAEPVPAGAVQSDGPAAGMAVKALRAAGYPVTTHRVRTVDGYLLTLVRLPRPETGKVAFMQHGLLDSAAAWASTGHLSAMACRLYQAGIDVFLGNLRGTNDTQSYDYAALNEAAAAAWRRATGAGEEDSSGVSSPSNIPANTPAGAAGAFPSHVRLDPHEHAFWDFGVDDHALDVLAMVSKIQEIKRQEAHARIVARHHRAGKRSTSNRASRSGSNAPPPQPRQSHRTADEPESVPVTPAAPADVSAEAVDADPDTRAVLQQLLALGTAQNDNDCRIVAVGHSMGGAVLPLAVLYARALGRNHGLSRLVLLSPAGMHKVVGTLVGMGVKTLDYIFKYAPHGPFPSRSSWLEWSVAQLLQDMKRTGALSDIVSALGTAFFGGTMQGFVFRRLSFMNYVLGGSSRKVVVHGVQCTRAHEWRPFDYGARENLRRYGCTPPPSFRADYGLLDVPIHFIAGAKDALIPPENLAIQVAGINAVTPGLATLSVFPDAGHLDFTLSTDDTVISTTLSSIYQGWTRSALEAPPSAADVASTAGGSITSPVSVTPFQQLLHSPAQSPVPSVIRRRLGQSPLRAMADAAGGSGTSTPAASPAQTPATARTPASIGTCRRRKPAGLSNIRVPRPAGALDDDAATLLRDVRMGDLTPIHQQAMFRSHMDAVGASAACATAAQALWWGPADLAAQVTLARERDHSGNMTGELRCALISFLESRLRVAGQAIRSLQEAQYTGDKAASEYSWMAGLSCASVALPGLNQWAQLELERLVDRMAQVDAMLVQVRRVCPATVKLVRSPVFQAGKLVHAPAPSTPPRVHQHDASTSPTATASAGRGRTLTPARRSQAKYPPLPESGASTASSAHA